MNNCDRAVYEIICRAAERGERCPTLIAIREALHIGYEELKVRWARLIEQGHISVDLSSRNVGYVVTILATGAATSKARPPRTHSEQQAYRKVLTSEKAQDPQILAQRIERDQQRIRAERLKWLEIEREKYGLRRMGRLPEDMAA